MIEIIIYIFLALFMFIFVAGVFRTISQVLGGEKERITLNQNPFFMIPIIIILINYALLGINY